jgi:hypothetical protein
VSDAGDTGDTSIGRDPLFSLAVVDDVVEWGAPQQEAFQLVPPACLITIGISLHKASAASVWPCLGSDAWRSI